MEIVITKTVDVDIDYVWSELFGSAWEKYPWWGDVEYVGSSRWNKAGEPSEGVEIQVVNPDNGRGIKEVQISWPSVVEAVSMCGEYENFDSDSADEFIQRMIFGEVRFS